MLPALSATAGATGAIAFLALDGLFTAHITDNIVILASQVVTRGNADLAELISVPAFMLALALAGLLGLSLARRGEPSALDVRLPLQVLLLLGFFLLGLRIDPAFDPDTPVPLRAGMLGIMAMAVQNALVQTELPGAPTTAVLTTSITRFAIASVDAVAAPLEERETGRAKAAALLPPILGFLAGCLAGVVLARQIGLAALMLPTFLATVATLLTSGGTRP
ncbi:MAG: DUF1275 family protein [Geminicoccaceae bacterium]